ncbi:MAG: CU044_2847 family protein [Brasilonema sp.]
MGQLIPVELEDGTITLRAFKNLAIAEISEVELKFGVSVDVLTGIPYIADGKAGCNLNITVKCLFPKKAEAQN